MTKAEFAALPIGQVMRSTYNQHRFKKTAPDQYEIIDGAWEALGG